jgi:hypothetical protein
VVEPDVLGLELGLAAGVGPLLMSVPVLAGGLPAPVWAKPDVASIVPAAVSASAVIHVFIAVLVFIKRLPVVLSVADTRFSWAGAGPPRLAESRSAGGDRDSPTLGGTMPPRYWA